VDQFQAKDVTFWGVFALLVWAVAILGGTISSLIPNGVLGGLHVSRLDGANMNQLRSQVADLQSRTADLTQQNAILLQRVGLSEQSNGEIIRRVGSLEVTVPQLVEALNSAPSLDRGAVTASTGTRAVTSFDADGGSVSFTTTPMPGVKGTKPATMQPMPQALTPDVATPDAGAFGIALGPPIDKNEAQDAWQGVNAEVGTLLLGLAPILGTVEGGSGRRLVAGPLNTEAEARELCGRMAKVGIACASVPFIGDPLPLLN